MSLKDLLFKSAFVIAFGAQFTLYLTFLQAYANPGKIVIISINTFGEAFVELVLLSVAFVFSSVVILWVLIDEVRRWND